MFLNEVIIRRSIAADKTFERMKESKVEELQNLSLQQPTGHWIVVESPRQSLPKK